MTSAVEEERITRKKYGYGLGPRLQRCEAGAYVLAEGGITAADVDLVVANDLLNPSYVLRYQDRVRWIGHHVAHAASTFYTSPFERAAVLVMDGRGSELTVDGVRRGETISSYTGDASGIRVVRAVHGRLGAAARVPDESYEDSVGWLYEAVAKAIGLTTTGDVGAPGKAMGLAPYGTRRYVDDLAAFYRLTDGEFRQSAQQQQALLAFAAAQLQRAGEGQAAEEVRADLAYAVQANTERIVLELARWLHRVTGEKALCLAGGVALNSVANFKILQETPFEELYVVPAAGDHGTAIGAALYGHHDLAGHPWVPAPEPFSPYLGRHYDAAQIDAALEPYLDRVTVERGADVVQRTAEDLAQGLIVGWFQGRSEVGPRALGNRSIFADPRDPAMKDRINAKVKHREPFRPFAPVVTEANQAALFSTAVPAYYMLIVPQVRESARHRIPAVTHVDGSARLQTASPVLNPRLCDLLEAFDRRTGVPVLLNTSFNDNEEPIVETPGDAIRCFLRTDLDRLVLGDVLVRKVEDR
nr:carbamoyltransferase C-terminal domain-containing protein [Saccharothrix deserti]